MRQGFFNVECRLDKIETVIIVFFNAGGDGENIRIKNDVFRRHADGFREDFIGACTDFDFALTGICLPLFVKRHHDSCSAIASHQPGLPDKSLFPFLHADGVDHALALYAFQAGLDNVPLGGINHDRHARNIRLGRDQVQKAHHGLFGLEHALVHIDINYLCAAFNLLAGNLQCGFIITFHDQALKTCRAGDVGAFTYIHEQRITGDIAGFQSGQAALDVNVRNLSRWIRTDGVDNSLDMSRGCTTTATDNIKEAIGGPVTQLGSNFFRCFIVLAKFIW